MRIQNATVLVTGANRGIGRALVKALLEAGAAKVYAAARNLDSLTDVIALDRDRTVPLQIDITDRTLLETLPQQANDVNLLFNNAGILSFGNILDMPLDQIAQQFETNFYGTLNVARALVPVIEQNIEQNGGGAIVNLLTLVSLASMPALSAYNASKAAAWSMTQSLRATVAARGIAVYGVFPGAIDTDMTAGFSLAKTSPAAVAAAILAGIEAGAEDIFPDPMATEVYAAWKQDHKAVEKQFAAL